MLLDPHKLAQSVRGYCSWQHLVTIVRVHLQALVELPLLPIMNGVVGDMSGNAIATREREILTLLTGRYLNHLLSRV